MGGGALYTTGAEAEHSVVNFSRDQYHHCMTINPPELSPDGMTDYFQINVHFIANTDTDEFVRCAMLSFFLLIKFFFFVFWLGVPPNCLKLPEIARKLLEIAWKLPANCLKLPERGPLIAWKSSKITWEGPISSHKKCWAFAHLKFDWFIIFRSRCRQNRSPAALRWQDSRVTTSGRICML